MATTKPTNPKDILGSNKVPMHLWPKTATIAGVLGLLDGALKYGRSNWRAVGIRASIYYDAIDRHMSAWFEGEDIDPDSGLPHLSHAIASMAIIIDAIAGDRFRDDRMIQGGYRKLMDASVPDVARLKENHKGDDPHHYTIADNGKNFDA